MNPSGLSVRNVLGTIGGAIGKREHAPTRAYGSRSDTVERKRSMRTRIKPMRIEHPKTAVTLVLMTLALLLVPGAGSLAEAQAGTTEGARGAQVAEPPEIETSAWSLADANSGRYLVGENPDEQLPIGSVNKIMSAFVVLEEGVDLDEEVMISSEAESFVGTTYSNVGLIAGERLSVRELLVATLVPSGTEAVYALAEHVGDGSVENFVGMMNDKASELSLEESNFESPAGLDTTGNYSSTRDLTTLTKEALEYPLFAEIVATREATISTQNREIEIFNTNQLLSTYPPATGVRTGSSPQAGENIVASAEDGGESYIAVVLGAEDSDQRFRAAEAILEHGLASYDLQPLVRQGEVYEEAPLPYRRGESVRLAATEDVAAPVAPSSEVERRVRTEELPPEAEAGQELGEVEVLVGGQSVGRSALVTQEGYEEASLWDRAWHSARTMADKALEEAGRALE